MSVVLGTGTVEEPRGYRAGAVAFRSAAPSQGRPELVVAGGGAGRGGAAPVSLSFPGGCRGARAGPQVTGAEPRGCAELGRRHRGSAGRERARPAPGSRAAAKRTRGERRGPEGCPVPGAASPGAWQATRWRCGASPPSCPPTGWPTSSPSTSCAPVTAAGRSPMSRCCRDHGRVPSSPSRRWQVTAGVPGGRGSARTPTPRPVLPCLVPAMQNRYKAKSDAVACSFFPPHSGPEDPEGEESRPVHRGEEISPGGDGARGGAEPRRGSEGQAAPARGGSARGCDSPSWLPDRLLCLEGRACTLL